MVKVEFQTGFTVRIIKESSSLIIQDQENIQEIFRKFSVLYLSAGHSKILQQRVKAAFHPTHKPQYT